MPTTDSAPLATILDETRGFFARRRGLGYFAALIGWALALGAIMSTQFLFQPFVWRGFGFDDILPVWLGILRDRVTVELCIALGLWLFDRIGARALRTRMALQAVAIVAGAAIGELLLAWHAAGDEPFDRAALLGRVVRWTMVGGSIAAMNYFWRSGSELAAQAEEARIEEARARRLAASSQLEMLRRQIEPHFLFNTLATIRRLQETDPAHSQRLLGRLFDYMSATIGDRATDASTLADEVRLVRAYLEVCAARMAGRLEVVCEVPDELARIDFPPLVLATLAENAIKHGIPADRGGTIAITAERRGDMIAVAVADDGVGFGEKKGGSGIGLANIAERLRLLHGPTATLQLGLNVPSGVRATVLLPWRGDRA